MIKRKKVRSLFTSSVSISLFNKGKANKIFEEVNEEGAKAVLKNNKLIGVIIFPTAYDDMMENWRIMNYCWKRANV